jgi:Family of unknown function (DUF6497)
MQDLVLIQDDQGRLEPGDGQAVPVPSGQAVTWADVIWNVPGPMGNAARFRFIAPAIARSSGTVSPDQAQDDLLALCRSFALPRLAALTPPPAQVIISLSDRPVPFGQSDPDATQFFEAFDLIEGDCEWSLF